VDGAFAGVPMPEEAWTPGGRGFGPAAFFGNCKQAGVLSDDADDGLSPGMDR
jgi:hypothetical protein